MYSIRFYHIHNSRSKRKIIKNVVEPLIDVGRDISANVLFHLDDKSLYRTMTSSVEEKKRERKKRKIDFIILT